MFWTDWDMAETFFREILPSSRQNPTMWGFFFRGWVLRNFFKVTLMSLFEIQNVFMIIKNDVLDRLGHG